MVTFSADFSDEDTRPEVDPLLMNERLTTVEDDDEWRRLKTPVAICRKCGLPVNDGCTCPWPRPERAAARGNAGTGAEDMIDHIHVFALADVVIDRCGCCDRLYDGLAEICVLPECGLIRCPRCASAPKEEMTDARLQTAIRP